MVNRWDGQPQRARLPHFQTQTQPRLARDDDDVTVDFSHRVLLLSQ